MGMGGMADDGPDNGTVQEGGREHTGAPRSAGAEHTDTVRHGSGR